MIPAAKPIIGDEEREAVDNDDEGTDSSAPIDTDDVCDTTSDTKNTDEATYVRYEWGARVYI